jgi:hypothetical protein
MDGRRRGGVGPGILAPRANPADITDSHQPDAGISVTLTRAPTPVPLSPEPRLRVTQPKSQRVMSRFGTRPENLVDQSSSLRSSFGKTHSRNEKPKPEPGAFGLAVGRRDQSRARRGRRAVRHETRVGPRPRYSPWLSAWRVETAQAMDKAKPQSWCLVLRSSARPRPVTPPGSPGPWTAACVREAPGRWSPPAPRGCRVQCSVWWPDFRERRACR